MQIAWKSRDGPFLGQLEQVVAGDCGLAGASWTNKQQRDLMREVDVEEVRLASGVDRRNYQVAELYQQSS